jgi:hypothetical protein
MTQNPPGSAINASLPSQLPATAIPDPASGPAWQSQPLPRRTWKFWHTVGLLAIVLAIVAIGLWTPSAPTPRVWAWLGTLVLLTLFAIVAGHGVIGLWLGLLIDERNRISLSRLQMILWTILVLSGFLTATLSNIAAVRAGGKDINPLAIVIPLNLLLLMGISTTSLVGSPLIRSTKTTQPEHSKKIEDEAARTRAELGRQGLPSSAIDTQGKIVIWNSPWDARWSDLFQGDEIGNAAQLDLGKVQMFYFTFILVLIYAVALSTIFIANTPIIAGFPKLDDGMVTLLGISHAGYLVNKVIPHSLA